MEDDDDDYDAEDSDSSEDEEQSNYSAEPPEDAYIRLDGGVVANNNVSAGRPSPRDTKSKSLSTSKRMHSKDSSSLVSTKADDEEDTSSIKSGSAPRRRGSLILFFSSSKGKDSSEVPEDPNNVKKALAESWSFPIKIEDRDDGYCPPASVLAREVRNPVPNIVEKSSSASKRRRGSKESILKNSSIGANSEIGGAYFGPHSSTVGSVPGGVENASSTGGTEPAKKKKRVRFRRRRFCF